MWEDWTGHYRGEACSAGEVGEILAAQEVVPPPEYIAFLEGCGRGIPECKRGFCLYYPENLEIGADLGSIPAPEGFYFAQRDECVDESFAFATVDRQFYYFRPRDCAVYCLSSQRGWQPRKVADSFADWLSASNV